MPSEIIVGEMFASAKNRGLQWCWQEFPEAKGRFPIIRSNLLESLPGSSKAYSMANCCRFLYFFFSSSWHIADGEHGVLPFPGLGLLFYRITSLPSQESGKKETNFVYHCGNSESYSKHSEAQGLSTCLQWETSELAKQVLRSEI